MDSSWAHYYDLDGCARANKETAQVKDVCPPPTSLAYLEHAESFVEGTNIQDWPCLA